jgi:phosphoglycolate phosphatase
MASKPLIAFDLDGTLVDSRRDLADSANRMLESYHAPPLALDEVAALVGDGARQLVSRVLEASRLTIDVDVALERFLGFYSQVLVAHTRPYKGIPDLVRNLAERAFLAVLTNKPGDLSERLLQALDLASYFERVIGGDSTFPRKPDPAGLQALMADAGVGPERALYVGDSMIDVETARRAGVGVVVAQYGFGYLREPLRLDGSEILADDPVAVERAALRFLASAGQL